MILEKPPALKRNIQQYKTIQFLTFLWAFFNPPGPDSDPAGKKPCRYMRIRIHNIDFFYNTAE
jgi:hypothetical protein